MHKSRRPIKNLASLLTDDNYKIEMFDVIFRNQAEREKCKAELLEKYGDSENDLTAFKAAKRKYAVSNACEKIKLLADKVICSNDEHIMEYMKKELV